MMIDSNTAHNDIAQPTKPKRVALFCRDTEAKVNEALHKYAEEQGYMIIPVMFTSEQDILDNPKEEYEAILTTESIMLPIAGIEIIKVSL